MVAGAVPKRKRASVAAPAEISEATERDIRGLLHQAARLADKQQFLEWYELFAVDCVYAALTLENERDQGLYLYYDEGIEALKERVVFQMGFWQTPRAKTLHTITNIEVVKATESEAQVRSYFTIYRTAVDGETGLYACGEYLDDLVRKGGRWRFRVRKAIVDTNVLPADFTELL